MTLPNVPNEVFTHKPFVTSIPLAGNQDVFVHIPDTMSAPEMCGNVFACHLSTASLRVTRPGPLTDPHPQARVTILYRGCITMSFSHLCTASVSL